MPTIAELTDPEAVLRAIAEYDKLGRKQFLAKYRYGPAKTWVLRHRGKEYESKAIAGAAVRFQYGRAPTRLHGGEETVVPQLRALGFTVEARGNAANSAGAKQALNLEQELTWLGSRVNGSAEVKRRSIANLRYVLGHQDIRSRFKLDERIETALRVEVRIGESNWRYLLVNNAGTGGLKVEAQGQIEERLRERFSDVQELQRHIGSEQVRVSPKAQFSEKIRVLLTSPDSAASVDEERDVVLAFLRGVVEILSVGNGGSLMLSGPGRNSPPQSSPPRNLAELERRLDEIDELDIPSSAKRRAEQGILRKLVLDGRAVADCNICCREFPVAMLITAHIKPRAKSSDAERRDYTNNVMRACTFGCDDLFERHYIEVRNGRCVEGSTAGATETVRMRVAELKGNSCSAWTATSQPYFEWHERVGAEQLD